jgi:Ca2+-binding RTX toxin-like protein
LGSGNDVLNNRAGTILGDILGGDGDDRFTLSLTAENIDGGTGFDTLDLSPVWSGVTIDLSDAANNLGIRVVNDSFAGIEGILGTHRADILVGNDTENLLVGNAGRDSLSGGAGNDTLEGGIRIDTLAGGEGNDVFVFHTGIGMKDVITDFSSGKDLIQLEGSAFSYGSLTGAVSADDFVTGLTRAALDASDRFIFRTTDATLWYDADGKGGKYATLIADFAADVVLTAADLILI